MSGAPAERDELFEAASLAKAWCSEAYFRATAYHRERLAEPAAGSRGS